MYTKIFYLLSLVIFSTGLYAAPKMYKWVDEEGNIHYSQTAPAGTTAEEINPPPKIDTDSAIKEIEKKKENFKKADEEKAKAAEEAKKKAEELAVKEENCRASKVRLNSLQNAPRLREVDEQGNITYGTEKEHQSRINMVKENVKKYCN